ncbi:hypothetical protein [Blattabacterium sp. (Cryptocercus kyebangensis)]|nr:hypothetical protein [Blattabacterium sp. (Cryptocercus kyebangensis)]
MKKIKSERILSYGPYRTYVLIENFLFVSVQISIDPKTGNLIS